MKYKNFYALILLLAYDNGFPVRKNATLPEGYDWEKLEREAAELTPTDAEILTMGESTERETLVKRLNLQKLDEVLDKAFEGELNSVFFNTGFTAYHCFSDVVSQVVEVSDD